MLEGEGIRMRDAAFNPRYRGNQNSLAGLGGAGLLGLILQGYLPGDDH